ncbi:MAG: sodium:solute symporter family protein [Thermoguttaceae bacterium]
MPHFEIAGLPLIDCLVIAAYLIGITAIGTWAARKVKSSTSFFISDRKFGKLMMMFFNFGTGTHSDQAVGVAAKTFRSGASGIWYQLLWLFSTPLYWIIAPMFRRMRAVTTSDFFEARYDTSVGVLYAFVAILNLTVNIGVMLKGSGAMIEAVSGGAIPQSVAIGVMTVMFLIYGVAGGLAAAIATDLIQGILTIVLSFLILPFALSAVGGFSGMRATIGDPSMFELVSVGGEIGLFYIVIISLNGLIGFGTQPHTMSLCAAGRTEMEARVGMTCGMFIKRFCTVAWVLTGLCAVALYMGQEVDIDHVYGRMARDLLPSIAPGLVGLFIASMLAAVMSSCDAFMVACSALFTENVYRKVIVRDAPDKHYMLVGRTTAVLTVLAGIVIAFSLENVVEGLKLFWKISAMMGLAFWVGLFWRRTTVAGAWIGTLVGFAAFLYTSKIEILGRVLWNFNARYAQSLKEFWEPLTLLRPTKDGPVLELALPWQMIFYLSTGLLTLIVVSLLTRRVSPRRLERFYACLRTPVGPDEPETEPFELPPGVKPAPRRVWCDFLELEIPKISRVGFVGLAAATAAVGLFLVGVYWIFSLGT